jgi:hypothetical protein
MGSRTRCRSELAASLLAAGCLLVTGKEAEAGGLRCSIGEVVVENLRIGQEYSLVELANLPLSITNTGDRMAIVRVDAVAPGAGESRQGASPIPDAAWVSTVPDSFRLEPAATQQVEIRIRIPQSEALLGKKYQVSLWSHVVPQAGESIACGLSSRVIFTIDPKLEIPGVQPAGGVLISLLPAETKIRHPVPQQRTRLEDCLDRPLVLKNPTGKKLVVELALLRPQESAGGLPAGCGDLLASASLELAPKQVELKPGEEIVVSGSLSFRPGEPAPSETLMAVVSARVVDGEVATAVYARIYLRNP